MAEGTELQLCCALSSAQQEVPRPLYGEGQACRDPWFHSTVKTSPQMGQEVKWVGPMLTLRAPVGRFSLFTLLTPSFAVMPP